MGNYFDSYDPSAYATPASQAQTSVATQPKSKTNWLSLVPSALAAGASFIPGVGSVVAGGLGAVGEAAREKLNGENIDLKKIGEEGALSAVPFALGRVAKVAKIGIDAAKGINVTSKGLQAADKVAQVAEPAAQVATDAGSTGGNLLQKFGKNLQESARGIAPGAKAVGQDRLGVNSADELNTFLSGLPGTQGKNARDTLATLEKYHAGWGKQIGDIIASNNTKLLPTDLSAAKAGIDAHLGEITGLPKTAGDVALVDSTGKAVLKVGAGAPEHAYIDNLYGDLGKVNDLKGLNDLRVKLDQDAINYGRGSNAPDPVKEQIAKAFRSGLSEYVGEKVPELASVQNLYSQSAHAQDFLKGAAAAPKGGVNLLGFFGGPKVGGGLVQGLTAKAGQAAIAAGDAVAGATPAAEQAATKSGLFSKIVGGVKNTAKYGGALAVQGATRAVAGALTAQQPGAPGTNGELDAGAPANPDLPTVDQPIAANAATSASTGIDYNAEADKILASGADAKTQAAQLDLLAKRQAIEAGSSTSSKPLSSAASQQLGNAQSGLAAINQLRSELSKDPNEPTTNAVAGVAGNIGRGLAGTQSYEAARGEVTDILARLRTGAAISKTEEAQYKALLPTAFDSPAVISQKLDRYEQLFQGIADRAQAGSPALEAAGISQN